MEHNHILALTTGFDEMELAIGDILQSRLQGPLIRVDAQAQRTPEHAESLVTRALCAPALSHDDPMKSGRRGSIQGSCATAAGRLPEGCASDPSAPAI
jgi:hypothetical protein